MPSIKKIKSVPRPVIPLASWFIICLSRTFRLKVSDPNGRMKSNLPDPAVFVFWHNRLLGLAPLIPRVIRRKVAILISLSRDGGYIAALIHAFDFKTIRGSSSKGGMKALWETREFIRNGGSIGITPDGPRGPRYTVQPGAVWIASQNHVPIIPVGLNTKRHWHLKSWDQTQIPKPFSEAELIIGEPIHVGRNLNNTKVKDYQKRVRDKLLEITRWDDKGSG